MAVVHAMKMAHAAAGIMLAMPAKMLVERVKT
jgi:DNA-binding cell septation regulator SpoVG